jgi:hypothetical protein
VAREEERWLFEEERWLLRRRGGSRGGEVAPEEERWLD